ncbi:hypothetical protein PG985_002876 [Apiospora marii]|uniref:uncharacterized protein n=1 Tax=Apiospora marii TaxID=335849 RepID=UPI0031326529
MSKAPEGAGKAAQQAEAAGEFTKKDFVEGFKTEVNKAIDAKKEKDDKLSGIVGELKKAGTEVVEGVLKDQAGQQLDPDKFLKDFWKAFDARLKQLSDVRKQLKTKGLPDLRATMGGVVHMTIYEHVVLPGLAKKEKLPNDKLVATFAEKFDKELDAVVKKKEFKMYKDAAADVASTALQQSFGANEEIEKKKRELAQLKKQPRASKNEKELMEHVAELKEKNQALQGKVSDLEAQAMKMNDPDAAVTAMENKYNALVERSQEEGNLIGELEQEREKLQDELKVVKEDVKKLTQGRGTAQGQARGLEAELKEQKERVANGVVELNKAKKQNEELRESLQEATAARTETNDHYDRVMIEFEDFKAKVGESGSGSKDAAYEETIKGLREQVKKAEEEIGELKAAQGKMLSKMEDDLAQADANAMKKAEQDMKTRFKNLAEELKIAQNETSKHAKENDSLKEKNKQLESTHRQAERKNADLTKKHADLTKKHEETVKAQGADKEAGDGAAAEAAKKLAEVEAERKKLKAACKDYKEREDSLKTITQEQKKQLEKLEAGKAGADEAGKELQELRKERGDLQAANQKLEADLKEQQNLAAAKAGDEQALNTLRDQNKKLQDDNDKLTQARGSLDERVSGLEGEKDEFAAQNENLKAELEKVKSDTTKEEENQTLQEQVKDLQEINRNLQDTLNIVNRGGNGDGLETLDEVPDEEEMARKTPEERAQHWQKQWAAAMAKRNEMDKDLGDLRRDYQRYLNAYDRVEKRREDAETEKDAMEARLKAAEAAAQTAEAATRAAEAAREAAEAAAAAAGHNTTTETVGPTRTMGEVTLQQRNMDAVPGATRDSLFAGIANIFGRGARGTRGPVGRGGGGGGGGGDPGRRPSATLATDEWLDRWLIAGFAVMIVVTVLGLMVMGAEGHKAAVWFAANHETRAQYANDWYYFTIPVPQLEYIFYIFTRAVWAKM